MLKCLSFNFQWRNFRKLYRKNGYVVNYNKIIMKKECRVVQLLWKDQNFFHNLWCCEMVCVDDEISEQIVPLLLFFYPNYEFVYNLRTNHRYKIKHPSGCFPLMLL
jgi:hypothetical protein